MKTRITTVLMTLLLGVVFHAPLQSVRAGERLLIHEWGTFTSLQNKLGRELTGINVDDEPVPPFVHNLSPYILSSPVLSSQHWSFRQKAAPRRHPRVTMRLETPVIYFYPPETQKLPMTLDVDVQFRGGWLTEFYPRAEAAAPGLRKGVFNFGELTRSTVSSLSWKGLRVGTDGQGPKTDEHVWTAPRKVSAVPVTTPKGESEKYLFYRGVGNLRAPLRVVTDVKNRQLRIHGNFNEVLDQETRVTINDMWLTHIRKDGTTAYRQIGSHTFSQSTEMPSVAVKSDFDEKDYHTKNLQEMKRDMHRALVADGLFADEATALLTTWERAYFKSPGLRLFFLVPRPWTDHYLPLSVSVDADIDRVMVGRIELISNEQRRLLDKLAHSEISSGKWINALAQTGQLEKLRAGRSDFGKLRIKVPEDFQTYLALGRFRNALVVAEERQRPTESLTKFIDNYGLHPFRLQTARRPASK